jgi:hypothetical protein
VDPDRVTDRVLAFLAEHEVVRNAPLAMAT